MKPNKFHRGTIGYTRILAVLYGRHSTVREAATSLGIRLAANVRHAIREMHTAGLVHVASWRPPSSHGGLWSAVWAGGGGKDAPTPTSATKPPSGAVRTRPEMLTFIAAVRCMQGGHATTRDISDDASGMSMNAAQALVRLMRELGLAHVAAYEHAGPTLTAAYAFGCGQDAPRPPRMTKREIEARAWAKRKARGRQINILRALAGVAA